jgi:hypothetical protein
MDKIGWRNFVKTPISMFRLGRHIFVTATVTVLAFISVGYVSCSKDNASTSSVNKCDAMQCQNGATCFKGICSCLAGFEGERCEKNAILRYTGGWSITEEIKGSTDIIKKGSKKDFDINIRQKEGTRTVFLIDNFSGNEQYDGVEAYEGLDHRYEAAAYTQYAITKSQTLPGTNSFIVTGWGSVNDLGTVIEGTYIVSYVMSNNAIAYDTVSFSGIHK